MENIENLFKHKIFFTQPREDCDYREVGKVKWSGIYKSNTIYNHKKLGVTDMDELLTQIKPFLYYLGSKDVNREGDGYIFETDLLVGLFWKYKNSNDAYDYKYIQIGGVHINNIGSELNFDTFYPRGDVVYRELEKPFEIYIDVHQEYDLLIVGAEELEDELEEDKVPMAPIAVSKPFNSDKCVVCLLEKPELLFIKCLHRCVCLKCEETSPFHKCPSCRTDISIKVKI